MRQILTWLVVVFAAGCTDENPEFVSDAGDDIAFVDGSAPPTHMLGDAVGVVGNCGDSLAGVGAGDFTIRFRIQTRVAGSYSTVMYQRATCGGPDQQVWFIRLVGEVIRVAIGETVFDTTVLVNDGQRHDVVVKRRGGVVAVLVDGQFAGAREATQFLGDDLPPLGIGSGDPCEESGPQRPLDGVVEDVCLTVP